MFFLLHWSGSLGLLTRHKNVMSDSAQFTYRLNWKITGEQIMEQLLHVVLKKVNPIYKMCKFLIFAGAIYQCSAE
jgi:hypothetical protein